MDETAPSDPNPTDSRPSIGGRWLPGWKGGLLIALPWLVLIWVRLADPMGDHGSVNVFSYLLVMLSAIFWLLWFLLASGQPWSRRLTVFILPILLVFGFFSVFRIERMSGEMIPTFVRKSAPKADQTLDIPTVEPVAGVDLATETANDFPGFLGSGRRLAVDHIQLDPDWQSRPPALLWKQPVGSGWSGFAVRNGYAVTMEQRGDQELVTCYQVDSGKPCWSWATPAGYRSTVAGDGPRATPSIVDGKVYSLGVFGKVAALDGTTGEPIWSRDLDEELGISSRQAEILPYGRSNSPLVVDDLLVVPFGGSPEKGFVSLLAMNRHTGETVWQGGDSQISCASPAVATLGGVKQILSVDSGRVAGYDLGTGEVLWSHPWPGKVEADCNVSQPVPVDGDRVFISKGYGLGAALLQIKHQSGRFEVEELWHFPRVLRTKFTNVVIHEGYVYGLSDGILECVKLETGERVWKKGRYRHGQILRVSNHLLVLSEEGEVFLVEATPERPNHVLGQFEAIEGKTWNTLALTGDRLLVRNGEQAACFRLPLAG